MIKISFVFYFLTWSTFVLCQGRVGNGADTIVCKDGQRLFLDYYEMDVHFLTLDPLTGTLDQIMEKYFVKLDRFDPLRSKRYRLWYADFFDESVAMHPFNYEVRDSGRTKELPKGCKQEQLFYQLRNINNLGKRYFYSKVGWESIESNHIKAGVILHELILREAIMNGQLTSESARLFNGWIASKEFFGLEVGEYEGLLKEIGFMSFDSPKKLLKLYNFLDYYFVGESLRLESADLDLSESVRQNIRSNVYFKDLNLVGRQLSIEIEESHIKNYWEIERGVQVGAVNSLRYRESFKLVCSLLRGEDKIYCSKNMYATTLGNSTRSDLSGLLVFDENKLSIELKGNRPEDYEDPVLGQIPVFRKLSDLFTISDKGLEASRSIFFKSSGTPSEVDIVVKQNVIQLNQ